MDDVARCSLLAMEKGGDRKRYIASGEHVTIKAAFETLAGLTGLKAPTLRLPTPVLRFAAGLMELGAKLTGSRPMLDRSQVDEFAGKFSYFDSGKAERELGYTYMPARQVLARTVAWLVDRGFVEEKRKAALRLDPSLKGAPTGFTVPVREVRASVGAGFIYPLLGEMRTMPGLAAKPAFMNVDLDADGNVVGLF